MKNYALLLVAVAVISTAFSRPSSALELAPMAGARFDTFQTTQLGTTYNSTFGYQFGGLLFFDLVPFLFKLRTGAIFKTRNVGGSNANGSFTQTDRTIDIPANLQVSLPLSLYVFGGAMYSSTQNSNCTYSSGGQCGNGKTNDDIPLNLGVGYNLINDGLFKFAFEGEYDLGTRNLSNNQSFGALWYTGYTFNALAVFGF